MTNELYTPTDEEFENMIEWSYDYDTKEELVTFLRSEYWTEESINEMLQHRGM